MNDPFIGNKNEIYAGELPATSFYPALKFSDFQDVFGFLATQSEKAIEMQMTIDRAAVHSQLKNLVVNHPNLESYSQVNFEDSTTAEVFYKNAVFSLTAANLIGKIMATDGTKNAADRQAALTEKESHLLSQYRQAIDTLTGESSGYTMELI